MAIAMASLHDVPDNVASAAEQCAAALTAADRFSRISVDGVECIAFTDGPRGQRTRVLVHAQHEDRSCPDRSQRPRYLVLLHLDNLDVTKRCLPIELCGQLPLGQVRNCEKQLNFKPWGMRLGALIAKWQGFDACTHAEKSASLSNLVLSLDRACCTGPAITPGVLNDPTTGGKLCGSNLVRLN